MGVDVIDVDVDQEHLTIGQVLNNRLWQIAVVVSCAAFIGIYWRTFRWWWKVWMADESYYSHAILIPFMSAFVVYINRHTLAKVGLKPTLLGLLLILPAFAIKMIGHMANTASTMGLTVPLALAGASMLLFGIRMTRQLIFPLGYLYFMCVLPGFLLTKLSFKIQILSTTVATQMLNIAQLNANQSGTQITLPHVDVMVGAPCSGFRMLISLLAFAVFFAYMKEGPTWGRLSLVALTAPLSLVANSLRVALIAIVGEFFGVELMHTFHDYSGFIVLAVAFIALWWLAKVVKCDKFRSML